MPDRCFKPLNPSQAFGFGVIRNGKVSCKLEPPVQGSLLMTGGTGPHTCLQTRFVGRARRPCPAGRGFLIENDVWNSNSVNPSEVPEWGDLGFNIPARERGGAAWWWHHFGLILTKDLAQNVSNFTASLPGVARADGEKAQARKMGATPGHWFLSPETACN